MYELIEFLRSKSFFRQLLVIGLGWLILLGLISFMMGFYTKHGEKVLVPDFKGKTKKNLDAFVEGKQIHYQIIDSVYDLNAKKGTVADQVPKPGSFVKSDRTIYLTLNAVLPPKVKMPNLVDLTLRQATSKIETYGLKLGQLSYQPDLAQNAVLKQLLGKKEIKPGTLIDKGSRINLVVGSGLNQEEILLPSLIGFTRDEAINMLESNQLTVGAVVYDASVKDSANAIVFKQLPIYKMDTYISTGQSVDIFLTNDASKLNP